jgi:hypothetical protein
LTCSPTGKPATSGCSNPCTTRPLSCIRECRGEGEIKIWKGTAVYPDNTEPGADAQLKEYSTFRCFSGKRVQVLHHISDSNTSLLPRNENDIISSTIVKTFPAGYCLFPPIQIPLVINSLVVSSHCLFSPCRWAVFLFVYEPSICLIAGAGRPA